MTESEKQEIVSRVLSSLSTNSATIDQLIETGACTDNDYFETGKGNKVSYANMMKPIHQKYDRNFSDLNKDIVKKTTELNISVLYPTGGIGGSNKYDLATAIGKVPEELRIPGLTVGFVNASGKVEKWEYQGGSWAVASFIQQASGGNKILEWATDAATTRKQVPANERKAGMQISYLHPESGWVNEQYIGTAVSGGEWAKDTNWASFLNHKALSSQFAIKEDFQTIEQRLSSTRYGVDDAMFFSDKAKLVPSHPKIIVNANMFSIPANTHIDAIRFRPAKGLTTTFYKLRVDGVNFVDKSVIVKYTGENDAQLIDIPVDFTLSEGEVVGIYGGRYMVNTPEANSSMQDGWGVFSNELQLYSLVQYVKNSLPSKGDLLLLSKSTDDNYSKIQDINKTLNSFCSGGPVESFFSPPLFNENIKDYDQTMNNNPFKDKGVYGILINKNTNLVGFYTFVFSILSPVTIYLYKLQSKSFVKVESHYTDTIGYQYISLDKPYPVTAGDYLICSPVKGALGISNTSSETISLGITDGIVTYSQINRNYFLYFRPVYKEERTTSGLLYVSDSRKYISLQDDDMTSSVQNWVSKNWTFSESGATPDTLGDTAYIRNKHIYHSDKRFMRTRIEMGVDTVLKIPVVMSDIKTGYGASCFCVDFSNKKLIIYKVGNGSDSQAQTSGYTNEILKESIIPENMIGNREYILELHKDNTKNRLILLDTLTAQRVEVEHDGWGAGRQNHFYAFYVASGHLPTIRRFQVYSLNRPDIVFAGDSITEGHGVADRTKRYADQYRRSHPEKKVVISALSGDSIEGIIRKFETEYNIYKPRILSVLIGANGGNNTGILRLLKQKCDNIGCKLILNRLTCQQSDDSHIAKNETIEYLNLPGARFDIATAKDNYPLVDDSHPKPRYNPSLYQDAGLHPNGDGQTEMYKRFCIDLPELDN